MIIYNLFASIHLQNFVIFIFGFLSFLFGFYHPSKSIYFIKVVSYGIAVDRKSKLLTKAKSKMMGLIL